MKTLLSLLTMFVIQAAQLPATTPRTIVFCRIHKQVIVQLSYAREVHALAGGNYIVKLSEGSELPIGRNYAKDFRARFG